MKKLLLSSLLFLGFFSTHAQQCWEDEFWREQAKKRYAKTLSMAGLYTEFYNNGKIKWQGKCLENGDPDSLWNYYNEDGSKLWEGYYTGKICFYNSWYEGDGENGADTEQLVNDTTVTGFYVKGKKDGEWRYYSNGQLEQVGHYRNGEPTGIWENYTQRCKTYEAQKISSYNYATQTKTTYGPDGPQNEVHLDSLSFEPDPYDHFAPMKEVSDPDDEFIHFDLKAAVHYISLNSVNSAFYQTGYSKLEAPLYFGGIAAGGTMEQTYWTMEFFMMPYLSAQVNDSTKLRLGAWKMDVKVGYDLVPSGTVDICPHVGWAYEQLNLRVSDLKATGTTSFSESNYRKYTNPGILIYPGIDFRVNIGHFSMHLDAAYTVDCSSQRWKYNGDHLFNAPKTNFNAWLLEGGIGLHIN